MLTLWGALGLLPAYAALIVTRGRIELVALPAAFVAGIALALLVPAAGAKGGGGLVASLAVATVAGAIATAIVMNRRRLMSHR